MQRPLAASMKATLSRRAAACLSVNWGRDIGGKTSGSNGLAKTWGAAGVMQAFLWYAECDS